MVKSWSREDWFFAIASGKSDAEIARFYGCSTRTVAKWRRRVSK